MSIGKILKGAVTGGAIGAARAGGVGIGDIARAGGLGVMGALMAKKRRDEEAPMQEARAGRGSDIRMMSKKKGGKVKKMAEGGSADMAQDKALIKKAFRQHDAQEHKGGKGTKLKLAKGGSASKRADGCATQGKTKGRFV